MDVILALLGVLISGCVAILLFCVAEETKLQRRERERIQIWVQERVKTLREKG